MTIDAGKLQRVLIFSENLKGSGGVSLCADDFAILHKAASAYAATLPREIEVSGWVLVHLDGDVGACVYDSEVVAISAAGSAGKLWHPVKFSTTAVLPRVKD